MRGWSVYHNIVLVVLCMKKNRIDFIDFVIIEVEADATVFVL